MTTVAHPEAPAALENAVKELWQAVAELVLTANDDQPEQGDLAGAEQFAEVVIELQGLLAQARLSLAEGAARSHEPAALYDLDRLLREFGHRYWRELRAHGPVSRMRGSTRRRGDAWPSWWSGVEQSLERCEDPLVVVDEALALTWRAYAASDGTTRSTIPRRSS